MAAAHHHSHEHHGHGHSHDHHHHDHSHGVTKVIIFGATGNLGHNIAAGLTHHDHAKHFHVTAVVRSDTLNSKDAKKTATLDALKKAGVNFVAGDVEKNSAAELSALIKDHEVVISTLTYPLLLDPQLKLIEAAKTGGAKFFIPSEFGFDYSQFGDLSKNPVPVFAQKQQIRDKVKASGLSYAFILNGFFTEGLISPFGGVDVANATITAPDSFNTKISTTTLADVGYYTALIVLHRNDADVKDKSVFLGGDTLSWDQIHQHLEAKFKKPFTKKTISKEEIEKTVAADVTYSDWISRFRVAILIQKGVEYPLDSTFNHKHGGSHKATTVAGFLEKL